MKFLAAMLVFMIAAQPVQAGFCDMAHGDGAEPSAAATHGDGHGSAADSAAGHECCDPPAAGAGDGPDTGCENMLDCGACVAGVAALIALAPLAAEPVHSGQLASLAPLLMPSHDSLPFRPPITIS